MANSDVLPDLSWDYPISTQLLGGAVRERGESGRKFQRLARPSLRQIELVAHSRQTSDLALIRSFYARVVDQPFVFRHPILDVGSWNILGSDAEAEHSGTQANAYIFVGPATVGGLANLFPIADLGLKVGDAHSLAADLKTSAVGGESVEFRVDYYDANASLITSLATTAESGTSYVRHSAANLVIPGSTAYLVFRASKSGTVETGFIRNAKMNRGAVALEFKPPFTASSDPKAVYVPRFFLVTFLEEPDYEPVGNEAWDIHLALEEQAGEALLDYQYPDPNDGIATTFLEEDHPRGVVLAGTWNVSGDTKAHGGNHRTNANTNTTDAFQWTYYGYGFRLWGKKNTNLGIAQILLDGASLGNVDFYSATNDESAPVLTKLDVKLGLHTVKVKATNTKNASSSANTIPADALETLV